MPQEKVAEREVGVGVVGDRLGKVRAPRGDARRRVRGDRTKGVGIGFALVLWDACLTHLNTLFPNHPLDYSAWFFDDGSFIGDLPMLSATLSYFEEHGPPLGLHFFFLLELLPFVNRIL